MQNFSRSAVVLQSGGEGERHTAAKRKMAAAGNWKRSAKLLGRSLIFAREIIPASYRRPSQLVSLGQRGRRKHAA